MLIILLNILRHFFFQKSGKKIDIKRLIERCNKIAAQVKTCKDGFISRIICLLFYLLYSE